MSARSSAARAVSPEALLSIGQVLAKLAPEFPDLAPSKLRFLEEQRLIAPARTASGYRKFSGGDIDRLRLVLSLQRDQYLPLKVIREYLRELDAGRNPAVPGAANLPSILETGRKFSRDELLRKAAAGPALLGEAVSASLIAPADVYGEDALEMLSALAALQPRGIEPRHLRGLRSAVARDLGLIDSALSSTMRRKEAGSRAKAAEEARELADLLGVVRGTLVRAGLKRLTS